LEVGCALEVHYLFFPDGDAAFDGKKCSWKPIDKVSVKIECREEDVGFTIAEFSLDKNSGMLGASWYKWHCERRK